MTGDGRTRRRYLEATAVVATGLVGAGCTGRTRPRSAPNDSGGSNDAIAGEWDVSVPDYELEDELRVYQWVNYWPRRVVRNFERVFGVEVTVDYYSSNEQLRQAIETRGSDAYDVVFPSDYMVNVLASQGLLRPIDLDRIPNWSNLERRWIREAPYDPGTDRYSAPYQWGTTGIAWRENRVDGPIESWDAMWNDRYAGRVTWLNDVRETMGASLKRLGYSLNTRDEDEIAEAKEALLNQRDLVREFDSQYTQDFLVNDEATPVHTWSGEAFIAYWQLFKNGSSPVGYRIPREGGAVWIDTAAITRDANRPNAAHAFINYLLAAKPGAAVTNYVRYATPNRAAKEYVAPEMLNNPGVYPPDDVREELEFIQDVGPAIEHYRDAWTEIVDH